MLNANEERSAVPAAPTRDIRALHAQAPGRHVHAYTYAPMSAMVEKLHAVLICVLPLITWIEQVGPAVVAARNESIASSQCICMWMMRANYYIFITY